MLLAVVAWSAAPGRGAGVKVSTAGSHAVAWRVTLGTQTIGFLKLAIFALSAIEYLPYMLNRCPTAVPKDRDRRPLTMAQKIAIWERAGRQGEWAEDGQRCTWQSLRICAPEAGYTLESNERRATDQ
jgi:hypothetical protein